MRFPRRPKITVPVRGAWKAFLQESLGDSPGVWGSEPQVPHSSSPTAVFTARRGLTLQTYAGRTVVFLNSLVLCPLGVRGRQRSELGHTRTAVTQPSPLSQRAAAKFLLAHSAGCQPTLGDPLELPLYRGEGGCYSGSSQ